MRVLGRHMGGSHLLICALVVLLGVLAVGVFGFGITPWLILAGAFCAVLAMIEEKSPANREAFLVGPPGFEPGTNGL
jgi:hypothetical protein